jgi:GNAT superfamily N-acetyltransferase
MTALDIRRFDADDDDAMRASMAVFNDASAVDAPFEHPWSRRGFEGFVRRGWDGEAPECFLAEVDGRPVGTAMLHLSQRDNLHLAWCWVRVHPDHRRRGHGSALFERMVEEARAAGRTTIGADGWDAEGPLAFAAKHGLERKSQAIMRRQHLAEVDLELVRKLHDEAAQHAAGYELLRITGHTPEDLLPGMAELVSAINDAPTDDLDIEDEVFTPERLTAYETSVMARGDRLYRLVAREKASGALAGHTVIAVDEERPAIGDQHDTAVSRAHRGHRLGLLLKAGMLLWLAEVEPQLETVDTWNAESNDHMIEVNERLGYRVMGREVQFQRSI